MSLSSRWQPEHLVRNRAAASTGGVVFRVQPGSTVTIATRTGVITARQCQSRAQFEFDNLKRRLSPELGCAGYVQWRKTFAHLCANPQSVCHHNSPFNGRYLHE